MTMARGDRVHLALRGRRRARRCARNTTVTSVAASRRRLSRRHEQRRHRVPLGGARERRLQRAERAGACAARCRRVIAQRHAVRLPQPGPAARRAACWSSAPRRLACSSPTKSTAPAGRVTLSVGEHVRLPRHVSRPRRAVVDGRVRASGTSATTRSTTSRARGGCRRRSSSARPSARRSISTRSARSASSSSAGSSAVRDGRRSSPAGCAISSRWPT